METIKTILPVKGCLSVAKERVVIDFNIKMFLSKLFETFIFHVRKRNFLLNFSLEEQTPKLQCLELMEKAFLVFVACSFGMFASLTFCVTLGKLQAYCLGHVRIEAYTLLQISFDNAFKENCFLFAKIEFFSFYDQKSFLSFQNRKE